MTLKKWQQRYRDRITALNSEDLFDKMVDAQIPDDWNGCFTDHARWRADESIRQVRDRYSRNARLAALVTEELAELLNQMAMLIGTTGWRGYAKGEIKDAHAVAAHIREVLNG